MALRSEHDYKFIIGKFKYICKNLKYLLVLSNVRIFKIELQLITTLIYNILPHRQINENKIQTNKYY